MNITFLIGNGFDLGIGLRTRYSDFMQDYLLTPCTLRNLALYKNKLAQAMEKPGGNWADLENALSNLSAEFDATPLGMAQFLSLHDDLIVQLKIYLASEMNRFNRAGHEREISERFRNALLYPCKGMAPMFQDRVEQALARAPKAPHNYRFVSFNYTPAFDHCLSVASMSPGLRALNLPGLSSANPQPVLHVHGQLSGTVILGADNIRQIPNTFGNPAALERGFAKPTTNDALGNDYNTRLRRIIEFSNLIVVFGTSLGITDLTWWRLICRWLHVDINHHVVVHARGNIGVATNPAQLINAVRAVQDRLLGYMAMEYPHENRDNYRNQIQVLINQDLFAMNLT